MGYTWTDGELITATKLNNTGGSDYDFIIEYDDEDGYVATKGTYNEVYTALQTRPVVGLYKQHWSSGANIFSRYIPITYVWYYSSAATLILCGLYNSDGAVADIKLTWESDGTIYD